MRWVAEGGFIYMYYDIMIVYSSWRLVLWAYMYVWVITMVTHQCTNVATTIFVHNNVFSNSDAVGCSLPQKYTLWAKIHPYSPLNSSGNMIFLILSAFVSGFHSCGRKCLAANFKGGQIQIQGGGGESILKVGKTNYQGGANQFQRVGEGESTSWNKPYTMNWWHCFMVLVYPYHIHVQCRSMSSGWRQRAAIPMRRSSGHWNRFRSTRKSTRTDLDSLTLLLILVSNNVSAFSSNATWIPNATCLLDIA